MAKAPEATPFLEHALDFRLHPRPVLARARPVLDERLDKEVEQGRVVVELAAIVAMDGGQHPFELVMRRIGPVRGLAQARLERPQPARHHLVEQRHLRGKITVDVGVGHAGVRRDPDHGRARVAEPAHMRPRDLDEPRFVALGQRRGRHSCLHNAAEIARLRPFAAMGQGEIIGRVHLDEARGGAGEFERLRSVRPGEQRLRLRRG